MKTESITCLYSPLHSKVESDVENATLTGCASNIGLKELSSEEEINQDARSFREHSNEGKIGQDAIPCTDLFLKRRFFKALKNEKNTVCSSLGMMILILLLTVGIILTYIFFTLRGKPSDLVCFI